MGLGVVFAAPQLSVATEPCGVVANLEQTYIHGAYTNVINVLHVLARECCEL